MNILEGKSIPSVLQNPFEGDKLSDIMITAGHKLFGKGFYFRGTITFQNGNTQGKQTFDGKDLQDVLTQMAAFYNELTK